MTTGDTLDGIATAKQITGGWSQLADVNDLPDPDVLTIGQHLRLPVPPVQLTLSVAVPLIDPLITAAETITGHPIPTFPSAAAVAPIHPTAEVTDPLRAPLKAKAATVNTVGTAAQAVNAALGEVGTPYVFGGATPGGFDCSGLVMWAYRHAGVTLPRTAAAQATAGRAVSLNELQPGDLLFFYKPVDHVVIYVGNGKIAEASQPGQPVHVRSMYLNGFVGARRLV